MTIRYIKQKYPIGTVLNVWVSVSGFPVNLGLFTVGKKTLYSSTGQTWGDCKKEIERLYSGTVQRIIKASSVK